MNENENKILNNQEEGNEPVTSPGPQPTEPQLNNTPVPTVEEEQAANIIPDNVPAQLDQTEATDASVDVNTSTNAEDDLVPEAGTTPETMFTQSQVDEIAGKTRRETREKTLKTMYARYGVNSEEELDNVFANAQRFDTLQEMYDADKASYNETSKQRDAELAELKEHVALLESGIDKERYDDARYILKGKNIPITVESITQELVTHPEWKKQELQKEETNSIPFVKKEQPTQISVLGNEGNQQEKPLEETERERAFKMFDRFI